MLASKWIFAKVMWPFAYEERVLLATMMVLVERLELSGHASRGEDWELGGSVITCLPK